MDLDNLSGRRKAAALLIALGPELSALVLKHLRDDETEDLIHEVVQMQRVPSEVRDAILQETYEEAMTREYIQSGGVEYARDLLARALGTQKANEMLARSILGAVDTGTERSILEGIEHNDPELAAEIRRRMFTFDDIVTLDDRSIQRVLQDVAEKDLTVALRIGSDEVKQKIFKNMSGRRA